MKKVQKYKYVLLAAALALLTAIIVVNDNAGRFATFDFDKVPGKKAYVYYPVCDLIVVKEGVLERVPQEGSRILLNGGKRKVRVDSTATENGKVYIYGNQPDRERNIYEINK